MFEQYDTRSPVIALEGNIGAGKSTLAKYVRRYYPSCHVIDEAESALMSAYSRNPERWGALVQIDLLTQRATALRLAHRRALMSDGPVILDRSIVGDRAFARANWALGRISAIEYTLWENLHEELMKSTPAPDVVVYLDADVKLAHERAETRDRRQHDRDYLEELAQAHDAALDHVRSHGVRVTRVKWGHYPVHEYHVHADNLLSRVMKEHDGAMIDGL